MKKTAAYPFWRKQRSSSTRITPGRTRAAKISFPAAWCGAFWATAALAFSAYVPNVYPLGSTQGSVSAMGYSQSWTMGSGSAGELYLSKLEKKLLGVGDRIGARSPLEGLYDDTRD